MLEIERSMCIFNHTNDARLKVFKSRGENAFRSQKKAFHRQNRQLINFGSKDTLYARCGSKHTL